MSDASTRRAFLALSSAALLGALLGCGRKPQADPLTETEITEFFSAVQDGDATIVDRLLSAKPALANARNSQGQTPLAIAQQASNDDLVSVIKRHGGK